jgi:hypothetical protein
MDLKENYGLCPSTISMTKIFAAQINNFCCPFYKQPKKYGYL